MTPAERKALVEQKLAEARAKIAAGLVQLAVIVDPEVLEPTPEPTPEAPVEVGGN